MYKNILTKQIYEYNKLYKAICKKHPSMSIADKKGLTYVAMTGGRGITKYEFMSILANPFIDLYKYQYMTEVAVVKQEIDEGIVRYYIKDDSLFDFFKSTELKKKEVLSILNEYKLSVYGVIGQNFSCTIHIYTINEKHLFTILTDDMNYSFVAEDFDKNNDNDWVFNLAMNFLFYINAFPECVLEGVPQGVKRNPKALNVSISDKIVSHKTVEHGFVRPHFRSGYFRHLNSDYFVNCKGQVRFIASTMVKGKAKTVISKEV